MRTADLPQGVVKAVTVTDCATFQLAAVSQRGVGQLKRLLSKFSVTTTSGSAFVSSTVKLSLMP
jgi:hypothetical protein